MIELWPKQTFSKFQPNIATKLPSSNIINQEQNKIIKSKLNNRRSNPMNQVKFYNPKPKFHRKKVIIL